MVDLIGPVSLRQLPESIKADLVPILEELKTDLVDDGLVSLTVADYNVIAEKTLDAVASKQAGYKTVFDVSSDVSKAGEISAFTAERYYQKVLTPKEVAGGTLESTVKTGTKKATGQADANPSSIVSKEFADEIGQKWGSIPEDFKATYRNNRAQGLSAPDAWSKTMVENYIREGDPVIKDLQEFRLTQSDPQVVAQIDKEIESIRTNNYTQMFDDYISMMYGGYESVIDAYNTTGRTQFIDGMLVPPFEMRKLTFVMSQHPFIKEQRSAFINLARQGRHGEALVKLRDAHAIIQGRGMKSFIPDGNALKDLFAQAKASDTNNILQGLPYQTNGYRQGERGIFEIWNYGGETAPMFLVDDHLDLLSAQYLTRRQAGVVAEVYSDWSNIMPELFPSAKGIDQNAVRFANLTNDYLFPERTCKFFIVISYQQS